MIRPSGRTADQLRPLSLEAGVSRYAEGSCLAKFGNTHVLVTASLEESLPGWLRGQKRGWVTAEYGMLPRATHTRGRREAASGKQSGRTQEIQRLIGRGLRSVVDLVALGERQITIDCDVLQADGGTRCASITGGFVALSLAIQNITKRGLIRYNPLIGSVSAVSCGVYNGEVIADLDYAEDSKCDVDTNFVINQNFDLIEIQGTAESGAMSFEQVTRMYEMARNAAKEISEIQKKAIGN